MIMQVIGNKRTRLREHVGSERETKLEQEEKENQTRKRRVKKREPFFLREQENPPETRENYTQKLECIIYKYRQS